MVGPDMTVWFLFILLENGSADAPFCVLPGSLMSGTGNGTHAWRMLAPSKWALYFVNGPARAEKTILFYNSPFDFLFDLGKRV